MMKIKPYFGENIVVTTCDTHDNAEENGELCCQTANNTDDDHVERNEKDESGRSEAKDGGYFRSFLQQRTLVRLKANYHCRVVVTACGRMMKNWQD